MSASKLALVALLKIAVATLARGEDGTADVKWHEYVSEEGSFRVLLPGKVTRLQSHEPLENFGETERFVAVAELKRGGAIASFLATAEREPRAYLERYTPKERIELLFDATMADLRKRFPEARILVNRETRSVQQHPSAYWKITATDADRWLEVQTLAFYAGDVYHVAEVLHFSKDGSRAIGTREAEKFLGSYDVTSRPAINTLVNGMGK